VEVGLLDSVRRKEVFLMQPTSPPARDYLIELPALADASRRASAANVTSVLPYFGSRAGRQTQWPARAKNGAGGG
jgi:ribose-phosphate pyrophosphokinase